MGWVGEERIGVEWSGPMRNPADWQPWPHKQTERERERDREREGGKSRLRPKQGSGVDERKRTGP